MSAASIHVTEPHPSVPKASVYLYGGRGGAGNYKRYEASELSAGPTATGPASRISLSRTFNKRPVVVSGRGGAGNVYTAPSSETSIFQFDEELLKHRETVAPVYHVGRGGAANYVDESKSSRFGSTDSSHSVRSNSSAENSLNRLARKLSRN